MNIANYAELVERNPLPKGLKRLHNDFVVEAAKNDWAFYHADQDIKETVEAYFEKFQEHLEKVDKQEPTPAPEAKATPTPREKPAPKPVSKTAPKRQAKPKQQRKPSTPKPKAFNASASIVGHISPAVRFVQRFVAMHDRPVPLDRPKRLLRSLQKAIVEKKLRKSGAFAKEIMDMQAKLLKLCNEAQSEIVTIVLKPDDLARFVAIAGGERVYKSILILKSFVGMQGKPVDKARKEKLLKRMENFLSRNVRDPFSGKVREAKTALVQSIKQSKPAEFDDYSLKGILGSIDDLAGLGCAEGEGCGCGDLGGVDDSLHSSPGIARVVSSKEMMQLDYQTIPMKGHWKQLLGEPSVGFHAMIFGLPGQGKSTFALMLARYLSQNHGQTLFVSSEEFGSYTLKKKLMEVGGAVENLHFSADLESVNPNAFNFVFIDSVQRLGLDYETFLELKTAHPNTSFLLIMQATKDGSFKGVQEWEHEVDIVLKIEAGIAETTKNRFAELMQMEVF